MKHLRWYSEMNPWMDCIITVEEPLAEDAKEAVRKAMDDWYATVEEDEDGSDWECYGEVIELALDEANIDHAIWYHRSDIDEYSDEWDQYEEFWESIIPADTEVI